MSSPFLLESMYEGDEVDQKSGIARLAPKDSTLTKKQKEARLDILASTR
jgi:hypothetical protein